MRRFLGLLTVALAVSAGITGAVWADDAGTININHGQKGVAAGTPVGDILQVTIHEYDDWAPCWGAFPWSKDGEWIVYQSYREELSAGGGGEIPVAGSNEICKMKKDGTGWMQLTNNKACDSHPSFVPPNHARIVFQSNRDEEPYGGVDDGGIADIFMMNEDGTNVELITKGGEFPPEPGCGCEHGYNKPVVSPDGAKIAYRSQAELHAMNTDADGSGKRYPRLISYGEHACNHHTWFPDNLWVLYDAVWGELVGDEYLFEGKPVGRSIFKAKEDGTQVVPLSDDNLVITGPDGQYIDTASNTYPDGNCTGWAAKGDNWAFASPDGQFIAYHTRYGVVRGQDDSTQYEYSSLNIMKADGSGKRTLVIKGGGPDGTDLDPQWTWVCGPKAWSSDSKWIAFKMWSAGSILRLPAEEGDEPDESEPPLRTNGQPAAPISIFLINIDTLKIIQLTEGYSDYRMWWSPNGSGILFSDRGGVTRDDQQYNWDLLVMGVLNGDKDNVIDVEEWGAGSNNENYDGNHDQTPDWLQDHVASLHNAGGEHYVTIEAPDGTTLQGVWTSQNPSDGDLPPGVTCPAGFFGFTVEGITPGSTIVVKLILPAGLFPTTYWKYSDADGFEEFTYDATTGTGAIIQGNVVYLHLKDGGRGDHDGAADGKIVEPGGPANFRSQVRPVPTLNQWGLIIFMILAGLISILYMRRKDIKT